MQLDISAQRLLQELTQNQKQRENDLRELDNSISRLELRLEHESKILCDCQGTILEVAVQPGQVLGMGLRVGTIERRIVAFATLRRNSAEEGEGVLFGVAPEAQGRGIYRSLMIGAMLWFRTRGTARMVVSTQVTNAAVQKVWTRLGFEPWKSNYTFHKWF